MSTTTGTKIIEYPELEQGSDEWLAARRGMLTASTIGRLITEHAPDATEYDCPECGAQPGSSCISKARRNPAVIKTVHAGRSNRAASAPTVLTYAHTDTARSLALTLAAERITGHIEPTRTTPDMWRGVEDEPRARDAYREHRAPVDEMGFLVREVHGLRVGYSPDGLVGDDGLIEIKSRAPKTQVATVLAGEVPAENMAQLQCGLWVTGRAWIDYISYAGGMALWVERVYPDPRWQKAILAVAREFEASVTAITTTYTERTAGLPMTERLPSLDEIRI